MDIVLGLLSLVLGFFIGRFYVPIIKAIREFRKQTQQIAPQNTQPSYSQAPQI